MLTIKPGALFVDRVRNATRSIVNRGNLQVNPGANLTLSADRIDSNGRINAPRGNVFLEAVNGDINLINVDTTDGINNGGDINISATEDITISGRIDTSGGNFTVTPFGFLSGVPPREMLDK